MTKTKQTEHTEAPWTYRPSYHNGEPCGYVVQSGRRVIADLTSSPEDLSVEELNARLGEHSWYHRTINQTRAAIALAEGRGQ